MAEIQAFLPLGVFSQPNCRPACRVGAGGRKGRSAQVSRQTCVELAAAQPGSWQPRWGLFAGPGRRQAARRSGCRQRS